MREIEWWVKPEVFPYIRDYIKTLEVWPNNPKTSRVQVGDRLWINRQLFRDVIAVRLYDSFATAVNREDFRKVWPPAVSREALCALWRGVYPARAERNGVLVFQLGPVWQ